MKLLVCSGTMNNDVIINDTLVIPTSELEITSSRSGGAGGQHVNKTDTRITVRWNVKNSTVLNEQEKVRVVEKLHNQITQDGDLIIHNSVSRSQEHNRKMALKTLAEKVRKALIIPKRRMVTRVPAAVKAARVQSKKIRGQIKKLRSEKINEE